MTTSPAAVPRRYPGRLFLALGLACTALGVIGYIVQISAERLFLPWYLPWSATLGVFLLIVSLAQARTVWRVLALLLVMLFAGAEWAFMVEERLPPYTGPIKVGESFPAFATLRADGTPFTQGDLEGDQNSVLVFFRGHW
jgi:hypothetical protein